MKVFVLRMKKPSSLLPAPRARPPEGSPLSPWRRPFLRVTVCGNARRRTSASRLLCPNAALKGGRRRGAAGGVQARHALIGPPLLRPRAPLPGGGGAARMRRGVSVRRPVHPGALVGAWSRNWDGRGEWLTPVLEKGAA